MQRVPQRLPDWAASCRASRVPGSTLHAAPPPSAPSPLRNALRPQYRCDATDRISISAPGSQSHFSVSIRTNDISLDPIQIHWVGADGARREKEGRWGTAEWREGVRSGWSGPRGACTSVLRRLPLARAPEGGMAQSQRVSERDTAPRRMSSCQPRERIPPRQRRPPFRQHPCPARDCLRPREVPPGLPPPPSSHHPLPPARIHQIGLHLPETVPPSSSLRPDRTTNSPARDADWSVWRFTAIGPIFLLLLNGGGGVGWGRVACVSARQTCVGTAEPHMTRPDACLL